MNDSGPVDELADIRARLGRLEAAQLGGFSRGVVWFAAFLLVSVVILIVVGISLDRIDKAEQRKAFARNEMTAARAEGRCEASVLQANARETGKAVLPEAFVPACMRSEGFTFTPNAAACVGVTAAQKPLAPGCYEKVKVEKD